MASNRSAVRNQIRRRSYLYLRILRLSERAALSIEILICLIIAAPFLVALITTLHHSLSINMKIAIQAENSSRLLRVRELLHEAMQGQDSSTLPIPLRIHKNGIITLTNGENNKVMLSLSLRSPASDSDALSAIILSPLRAFKVMQRVPGSAVEFLACPKFDLRSISQHTKLGKMSEIRSFLGLSVDGTSELVGEIHFWKKDDYGQRCYHFNLSKTDSMIVPQIWSEEIHNVTTIIPILSIWTLYIDRRGELRYLNHRGEENIENQPLISGLKRLNLNLEPRFDHFESLSADLVHQDGSSEEIFLVQQIATSSIFDLLLN